MTDTAQVDETRPLTRREQALLDLGRRRFCDARQSGQGPNMEKITPMTREDAEAAFEQVRAEWVHKIKNDQKLRQMHHLDD